MNRDPSLVNFNKSTFGDVTLSGFQTISNKSLTGTREPFYLDTTQTPNGLSTPVVDLKTANIWYFNTNTAGAFTPNFRWDASTTLTSVMSNGEIITAVLIINNGATAYGLVASPRVDGAGTTARYAGGSIFTSGSASGTDMYTFMLLKTSGIFISYISQTKFG